MENKKIREKLIGLAVMNTFNSKQLSAIANELIKDSNLSLEEIIWFKNIIKKEANIRQLKEKIAIFDKEKNRDDLMKKYQEADIHFCTIVDEDYPLSLKETYLPPAVLFYQGNWKLTKRRRLGIVGSRKSTEYGERVLTKILPPLVQRNVTTISGLAAGIDQQVHSQTIRLGGDTIAVIGTGIDQHYPKNHVYLQQKIGREQLLISEYPLGVPPAKYHFPMRNRIIAGLSHGTLVIEAQERSGSLITANLALQENREVFAVPGSILSSGSKGTNQLIQAGAKLVLDVEDIFDELRELWLL